MFPIFRRPFYNPVARIIGFVIAILIMCCVCVVVFGSTFLHGGFSK